MDPENGTRGLYQVPEGMTPGVFPTRLRVDFMFAVKGLRHGASTAFDHGG